MILIILKFSSGMLEFQMKLNRTHSNGEDEEIDICTGCQLSVDLDISVVAPKTYLVFACNIVSGFLLLCFFTLVTAVYPVKYNMVNELFHNVKFERYIVITVPNVNFVILR